jgi:hypothetical protein
MCRRNMYPSYAPPLGVALVAVVVVVIVGVHGARRHLRGVELTAAKQAWRRIHHGRRTGDVEAILGGIHGADGFRTSAVVRFFWGLLPRRLRGGV